MQLLPVGSLPERADGLPEPLLSSLYDATEITRHHTVLFIPVELVPRVAVAFVAAHSVHTDLLTASVVDAALVGVSAVGKAIEGVPFVASTCEGARVVDAAVVTGPIQRTFIHILARLLIC